MGQAEDGMRGPSQRKVHFALPLDEANEMLLLLACLVGRGEASPGIRTASLRMMLVTKDAGHDCEGLGAIHAALSEPVPT